MKIVILKSFYSRPHSAKNLLKFLENTCDVGLAVLEDDTAVLRRACSSSAIRSGCPASGHRGWEWDPHATAAAAVPCLVQR